MFTHESVTSVAALGFGGEENPSVVLKLLSPRVVSRRPSLSPRLSGRL